MDGKPAEVLYTETQKPDPAAVPTPPPGPGTGNRPRSRLPELSGRAADPAAAAATVLSATDNAIGAAAVAGVTTAFLDAYLKKDTVAVEWLEKDAPRWLREKGEFKKK
jgi:hypothetical protein